MTLFLLSFVVMALAIVALCTGVLLGRGPLRGTCGADAALDVCALCRGKEKP